MNLLAQRDSFDVLHGDEVHTIALTNLVDVGDVRMIERGRFTEEIQCDARDP